MLRRKLPLYSATIAGFQKQQLLRPILSTGVLPFRSMATGETDLTYNDVADLQRKEEIALIDVRNPEEVKEGSIPGSFNIPLNELESALQLDNKDFELKYSLSKPQKDAQMVFSCRSGNRSRRALEIAQRLGYTKSKHYIGGWIDWVEQTK